MPPSRKPDPLVQMAALMLVQGWDHALMTAALRVSWDHDETLIEDLVHKTMTQWDQPYPPNARQLTALLKDQLPRQVETDERACELPDLPHVLAPAKSSEPIAVFSELPLPQIHSQDLLAEWLAIDPAHLDWFADCEGRLARRGPDHLRHYRETWLPKRTGGHRLIEAPRPKLKAIQRKILHGILDHVPVHDAAHGFVRERDCRGHAALHAGEDVVLTVDLRHFFPSVSARRVFAIFRCLGYAGPVARALTGLVTTQTPPDAVASLTTHERPMWRTAHLPQGAPTSPALANLAAYGLDFRLSALARRLGARYSRYADDLAFSGDRGMIFEGAEPMLEQISEIVADCGFRVNRGKTRIMRRGRRQRVTGIVVNQHLNVAREDFDRLKAILTNCLRHGPSGQNRAGHPNFRAHLTGRVGWVAALNPRRGEKLYALIDRINWLT